MEPRRRMTLLTTTAEVAALCAELAREPYVAIDTEFMRDHAPTFRSCAWCSSRARSATP